MAGTNFLQRDTFSFFILWVYLRVCTLSLITTWVKDVCTFATSDHLLLGSPIYATWPSVILRQLSVQVDTASMLPVITLLSPHMNVTFAGSGHIIKQLGGWCVTACQVHYYFKFNKLQRRTESFSTVNFQICISGLVYWHMLSKQRGCRGSVLSRGRPHANTQPGDASFLFITVKVTFIFEAERHISYLIQPG